jgi:hypothetical protein
VTHTPLTDFNANDPIWGFVAELTAERFTGEVILGVAPRVRLFVDDGHIYLAERDDAPPLSSRLVAMKAVTPEQLAHGVMMVDGTMSLARLFQRESSIDKATVQHAVSVANSELLADIANDPVVTAELHPGRRHSSGLHEWEGGPRAVEAPDAQVTEPELLQMTTDDRLAQPLRVPDLRPIEPIRLDQPGDPASSEASVLQPPPPLPALGLEAMSGFEAQFAPLPPPTTVVFAPPADPAPPATPDAVPPLALEPDFRGVDLPRLGTVSTWTEGTVAESRFRPLDGVNTDDLPKLATETKSVERIRAEQQMPEAIDETDPDLPVDERPPAHLAELPVLGTSLHEAHEAHEATSLPTFASIAGAAPDEFAHEAELHQPHHHESAVGDVGDGGESEFQAETPWNPPPPEQTATEIWQWLDQNDAPAPDAAADEAAPTPRRRGWHRRSKD